MSTLVVNDILPRNKDQAKYDLCRAWSKFSEDGISASFNISCFIDSGADSYRVGFGNSMTTPHYAFTEGSEKIVPSRYLTDGMHFEIPDFNGYGNITVHGEMK